MHTRTGKQASLESFSRNQTRLGENDSYSSYAFMSAAEIFSKWSPGGLRPSVMGGLFLQVSYITFCSVSSGLIWLIGRRSDTGD